jgi:hypothetical protein
MDHTTRKNLADLASAEDRMLRIVPRVDIKWTENELASLAELVSSTEAAEPTEMLIRAMRG